MRARLRRFCCPSVSEEDQIFLRKYTAMALGNMMEWFDFSSFGALIDIIGMNFFPPEDSHTMQLLKSLAIYGAAFVMRPIGGVAFGYIGDRVGRKRALEISILMMFFPSLLIGCLPTYKDIGYYSSILLLVLRLCQGLAAGGELVGAFLYTLEACKGRNVGFWGGATKASGNFGTTLGVGLATVLRSTLSKEQLLSWGWRIPFLASIVFGVFGLAARMTLKDEESDNMANNENNQITERSERFAVKDQLPVTNHEVAPQQVSTLSPLMQVLHYYSAELAIIVVASTFWACSYYTTFVWLTYFMQDPLLIGGDAIHYAWYISFISNFCLVFSLPMGGTVGDFISKSVGSNAKGSRYALEIACILMMVLVIPAFLLIMTRKAGYALFGQFLFLAPVALYGANLPYFMMQMVNQRNLRYTSMGLGYNLSHALFTSTTTLVQTTLIVSTWLDHHPPHHGKDIDTRIEHSKMILDDPRLRPAYYLIAVSIVVYLTLTIGVEFNRNRRLNHGLSMNLHNDVKQEAVATPLPEHRSSDKTKDHDATVQTFTYEELLAQEDQSSDEEKEGDPGVYYHRWKQGDGAASSPKGLFVVQTAVPAPSAPPSKYQYIN